MRLPLRYPDSEAAGVMRRLGLGLVDSEAAGMGVWAVVLLDWPPAGVMRRLGPPAGAGARPGLMFEMLSMLACQAALTLS